MLQCSNDDTEASVFQTVQGQNQQAVLDRLVLPLYCIIDWQSLSEDEGTDIERTTQLLSFAESKDDYWLKNELHAMPAFACQR